MVWTNTTTLKTQVQHPGQKIFTSNKKILRNRAQQELEQSLNEVQNRRMVILETIVGLKDSLSKEMS